MLEVDPVEQPTRPKCGCPAESPWSVPVLVGNWLEGLAVFKNGAHKAVVPSRFQPDAFRKHQHFNRLSRIKWQTLQSEFTMIADGSLNPMRPHSLSVVDPAGSELRPGASTLQ